MPHNPARLMKASTFTTRQPSMNLPLFLQSLALFGAIPTLYGISKTAPYFHDNSAATLEDVIRHYQLDFLPVRRIAPPCAPHPDVFLDEDIAPLIAYLKRI